MSINLQFDFITIAHTVQLMPIFMTEWMRISRHCAPRTRPYHRSPSRTMSHGQRQLSRDSVEQHREKQPVIIKKTSPDTRHKMRLERV